MTNPTTTKPKMIRALSDPEFVNRSKNKGKLDRSNRVNSDPAIKRILKPISPRKASQSNKNFKKIHASRKYKITTIDYQGCSFSIFHSTLIRKAPGLADKIEPGKTFLIDEFFTAKNDQAARLAFELIADCRINWFYLPPEQLIFCCKTLLTADLLSHYVRRFPLSGDNLLLILELAALTPHPDVMKRCSKFITHNIHQFDAGYLEQLFARCAASGAHTDLVKILKIIKDRKLIEKITDPEIKRIFNEFAPCLPLVGCNDKTFSIVGHHEKAPDAIKNLKQLISSQKSSTQVWLSLTKKCSPEHISQLNRQLENSECPVTHIYITSFDYVAGPEIDSLIQALEKNASVTLLRINGSIAEQLPSSLHKLVKNRTRDLSLDLSFTNLGEGADLLSQNLQKARKLKQLDLSAAGLSPQGATKLLLALITNTALEVLRLNSNGIDDKGCSGVRNFLHYNRTLQILELRKNRIKDEGARLIAEGLKKNRSLRCMDLSRNLITNEGAAALSGALKENKCLEKLRFEENTSGETGVHLIENVLNEQ